MTRSRGHDHPAPIQEPLARHVGTRDCSSSPAPSTPRGSAASRSPAAGASTRLVEGGVESPWERIRALDARCSTPLGMALRGRFLVGSRPLEGDLVRRFVASAAESGIDVFRMHDPLNDVTNLVDAVEAVRGAGKEVAIGLVHNPGPGGESDGSSNAPTPERARRSRGWSHDPAGSLDAGPRARTRRAGPRGERTAGRSLLPGSGRSGARRLDRGSQERTRTHCLRHLPDCALHPPRLRRGTLAGALRHRSRNRDRGCRPLACLRAGRLGVGDVPVPPLSPRDAVSAAEHDSQRGSSRA